MLNMAIRLATVSFYCYGLGIKYETINEKESSWVAFKLREIAVQDDKQKMVYRHITCIELIESSNQ